MSQKNKNKPTCFNSIRCMYTCIHVRLNKFNFVGYEY